jgi:hypothetical protein
VQAQLYVAARAGHSATHCTAMNQVEPGASHPPTHLHSRAQGSTHLSWSSSWPQVLPCCTAPAGRSAVQHRTESQSEHQLAKAVTAARAPCPAAALATASRHPCQHTAATQHIMQYWWWVTTHVDPAAAWYTCLARTASLHIYSTQWQTCEQKPAVVKAGSLLTSRPDNTAETAISAAAVAHNSSNSVSGGGGTAQRESIHLSTPHNVYVQQQRLAQSKAVDRLWRLAVFMVSIATQP